MSSFVALLRGINVGGKNLVRMPDLAACFRDAGYRDVHTYIQSGNVLFTADRPGGPELEAVLERMLEERFAIPILVVVRSRDELAATIAAAPTNHGSEELRSDVFFLKHQLTAEATYAELPELRGSRFGGARSRRDLLLEGGGAGIQDPHHPPHGHADLPADDRAQLAHDHAPT